MSLWKKIFSSKDENLADTNVVQFEQNEDMEKTKLFVLHKKIQEPKQVLPAVLKVISGNDEGLEVVLASKQVNIGRLPGSELLLNDNGASRLHAFVVNEDGKHVLYDGKSMNGTYLNNQRITKKVLNHGDSIKIASTVIVYELQ